MRPILYGLAILALGFYVFANDGKLRFPTNGDGPTNGNISGYLSAPSSSTSATKSAADRILN